MGRIRIAKATVRLPSQLGVASYSSRVQSAVVDRPPSRTGSAATHEPARARSARRTGEPPRYLFLANSREAAELDRAAVEARRANVRRAPRQVEAKHRQARQDGDEEALRRLDQFARELQAAVRPAGSLDRYSY